ncbi:DHHC palmitoyltransferase-domain-containing protein [Helicostylum pulchrum]|nr:DHHC palmitoyltransferase-domain-containing protein [Helicostylum pulchrum]
MNVPKRHSVIERIQDQSSLTVFQSNFFHNSSVEPDSLEDFDFDSVPTKNMNTLIEDEPIAQSSGVTSNSIVASYVSTAPMLQTKTRQTEEYCLSSIKDNSQETLETVTPSSNNYYHRNLQQQRPLRNYQLFPGNTRFLCGGRLVTSRDYRAFIAGLFIFITPTVLFSIFTCPYLWTEIHPAVPIVFAYLFILAFVSMLKTSWTDPGIIPRNLDPVIEQLCNDETNSISSDTPPRDVWIKDTSYSLRYCETCRIFRPPRASHCRQCDNCVEFEDHHCAWLNNCIAAALLCIFVIASAVYQLLSIANQHEPNEPINSFSFVFSQAPVSFVLAIYCFILLWLVGGLTLYHCSLVLRGVTTHEQIRADILKAKYPELHINPYNKMNPFKNMFQVLCQPQPKSYLRRRKMANPVIEK